MSNDRAPSLCLDCEGSGQVTADFLVHRTGETVHQQALCLTCSGDGIPVKEGTPSS